MKRLVWIWVLLMIGSGLAVFAGAENDPVNAEVVWALDYQLPSHECKKPKLRNSNQPDQIDKFERKSKRYRKCIAEYQTAIIEDHQRIVASVEHGISRLQAEILVKNLHAIEATVVETGEDISLTVDPFAAERLFLQPARPSI